MLSSTAGHPKVPMVQTPSESVCQRPERVLQTAQGDVLR